MGSSPIVTFSKRPLCRTVVGSQWGGTVAPSKPEEINGLHGQGKAARRAGSGEARRGSEELQSEPAAVGLGRAAAGRRPALRQARPPDRRRGTGRGGSARG